MRKIYDSSIEQTKRTNIDSMLEEGCQTQLGVYHDDNPYLNNKLEF